MKGTYTRNVGRKRKKKYCTKNLLIYAIYIINKYFEFQVNFLKYSYETQMKGTSDVLIYSKFVIVHIYLVLVWGDLLQYTDMSITDAYNFVHLTQQGQLSRETPNKYKNIFQAFNQGWGSEIFSTEPDPAGNKIRIRIRHFIEMKKKNIHVLGRQV